MTRPSESGHWYAPDGSPCYEVPAKDGSMRAATLRDARKMGLYPGVTTIIRCAAAPGLERWKQNQVLLAALTLPRKPGEPENDWLDRVIQDSQEQGRKAADRGTRIHAAIQGHFEGQAPEPEMWPHVQGAVKALEQYFGKNDFWIAEQSFAHSDGFGGKVDLHYTTVRGVGVVVDVKTKEFDNVGQVKGWDDHAIQLAAYAKGLGIEKAACGNLFVSASVPGLATLILWSEEEIARGWTMFQSLLAYWQAKHSYWPSKVAA
jgi:hypothetical protein